MDKKDSKKLKNIVGVLTGDIVKSSDLSNDKRFVLYQEMQGLSSILESSFPHFISHPLDNFRGDGWQLIVDEPKYSLAISVFIRTYFRYKFREEKLDTRVAIAIGDVDYIPKNGISEGFGSAYSGSGMALDAMKSERMQVVIFANKINDSEIILSLVKTFDELITKWTAAQCQAVNLALLNYTQVEIGKKWKPTKIAQSSVANHLKAANWAFVRNGIALFEALVSSVSFREEGTNE